MTGTDSGEDNRAAPTWAIELPPEWKALLPQVAPDALSVERCDGKSPATGWRFNYQHCIECGSADRGRPSYDQRLISTCHLSLLCQGRVRFEPWTGRTSSRQAYACCRGVAGRFLGEAAWMPPRPRG